MPLSTDKFCANQWSETYTLCKDVNEILPHTVYTVHLILIKLVIEDIHDNLLSC